ncbi:hypothetical protein PBI_MRMAGOO_136 [Mycobacterium phage MrMagoo]|uniref:Uncharacterized protein n=1 Tax=Mycobacterium phage MrMagoo TaxID=1927020 RepID=A0A1L6BYP7_9CAUD|nr:hypothetical protein J4U04_gp144 [Mycobacterium phage MrMagoo]APQ42218.1 hypothetical protein PBI_MRMAGOO_136 [Mycobacterium phage MrMagoo]ARM70289.1 hypothetical protein SEA_GARDENSALSA_134 [Mycobacterium phage GardenSalsa]
MGLDALVSQQKAIDHISKAEGWHIVSTLHHGDDRMTRTYVHLDRGVAMVGWTGERLTRLSWINKYNDSPAVILAADSRFELATAILTGERTR